MIKTIMKDAKNKAQFTELKALKEYLKDNGLTVEAVEKIAYTMGIYGCNGYLLRIQTNRHQVYAFTGRSSWMFNCTSLWVYNDELED